MLPVDLLVSDDPLTAAAPPYPRRPIVRFQKVMSVSKNSKPRPKTASGAGRKSETAQPMIGATKQSAVEPRKVADEDSIRIVVVDDHPLFRHGLVQLLNSEQSFAVCGEASSAPEAMAVVRREK